MDHFGIGAAITGAARIYLLSARRTGRTTSLIDSVADGDRIVCATNAERDSLKLMLLRRGMALEVIAISPEAAEEVFARGTPTGRTIFDHSWVERFYLNALSRAENEIDFLQQQSSGKGEAHEKTQRATQEITKWRAPDPCKK